MKKGFTLVEIMMVVAILALLCAIAIPNLCKAKLMADCQEGDEESCQELEKMNVIADKEKTIEINNKEYRRKDVELFVREHESVDWISDVVESTIWQNRFEKWVMEELGEDAVVYVSEVPSDDEYEF